MKSGSRWDLGGWLTEERLRVYPLALVLATVFPVLAATFTLSQEALSEGEALGGDYRCFYGAGRILADGLGAELFDRNVQEASQAGLVPGGRVLPFAYPPFYALPYWPLALLPYTPSFVLHCLLMLVSLCVAVHWLRPVLARVDRFPASTLAMALLFGPVTFALLGGQNTALTLLLVAGVWRGLHEGRDLRAGLCLGLLLFKPQFGLPLLGLLALGGSLRIPAIAAGVGLVEYGLGAWVTGPAWPVDWWTHAWAFRAGDEGVNASNTVGLLGFAGTAFGDDAAWATAVAAAAWGALLLALVVLWWRAKRTRLHLRMAVTSAGLVLLAPHAMAYDAGLAFLALAAIGEQRGRAALPGLLLIVGTSYAPLLTRPLGAPNPIFLTTLAILAWSGLLALGHPRSGEPTAPSDLGPDEIRPPPGGKGPSRIVPKGA